MRKTHFERLESETWDALKTMQDIQIFQLESDKLPLPEGKARYIAEAHQRVRQSISLLVMAGSKLKRHQYWLRVYFLRYMNYANNREAAYADQLKSLGMQIPKQSEKINLMLSYLHKAISEDNSVAVLSFIYVTEYCMNKMFMSEVKSAVGFDTDKLGKGIIKANDDMDGETIEMFPEIVNLLCEDDLQFLIETSRILFKLFQVTHSITE
ncbi:hypothetical protein [Marinicella sp. W31]|uniref:hypothetical protein n=1 Tax=Marinicella sp. W31 TaxID=3023713 RepID=UPI0037572A2A